ncbi:TetR family transcriptional regulator [Antricoccus suffuscus]|uniref:TetR family transcriptional regulator n=1 Tax=Antricoccus suffuscus TaxID=1629062 RepID=A0A2T0ZZA6_9ACTN|nr:TetR family transcriptional regulator [Antricoccus suffuscus]
MASAIGLDPTKLSKSLSGRRRFEAMELKRIADCLGVSLDWLAGGDEPALAMPEVTAPPERAALSDQLYSGPKGDTRQRIIEAAWPLIAERGLHSVRVSDVAERCGVSSAAVHYHFRNRQEMLEESLRVSVRDAYDRQVAELESISDPLERLLHLLELQMPLSEPMLREWSIWLQVWSEAALNPRMRDVHAAAYERWQSTVRGVIEFGQQQGTFRRSDAALLALKVTAMVDGLGIQLVAGNAQHTAEGMREVLRDFVQTELVTPI